MSIAKIDLRLCDLDRKEISASVDSKKILKKFKVSELNKLIDSNEDIWWTGEAEEYFENELGFEVVASGNSYNHESDLSDIMQWSIMAPKKDKGKDLYSDGILLVQLHQGGDARGNYDCVKVYKWEGEDTLFFLEHCVGWYAYGLDGEPIEGGLTERFQTGYCANPTYELNKHIVKIIKLTENKATVELDDGSTVNLEPEHAADYA